MATIDKGGQSVASRLIPRLRLSTFLVVVACVAVGLSWETNRRCREAQELAARRLGYLRLVAERRKQLGEKHRRRALAVSELAENSRRAIELDPVQVLRREPYLPKVLALRYRQIEWEWLMAENAKWAAAHPDQPWPDAPPYPAMVSKPGPSTKQTTQPKEPGPYQVPRIVKKPE